MVDLLLGFGFETRVYEDQGGLKTYIFEVTNPSRCILDIVWKEWGFYEMGQKAKLELEYIPSENKFQFVLEFLNNEFELGQLTEKEFGKILGELWNI